MKKKKSVKKTIKKRVKLSRKYPRHLGLKGFLSFFILHELQKRRLTGEQLAKKVGKRKGVTLAPGTIYPALKRLRKQKLIVYRKYGREKVYRLSDEGLRELRGLYALLGSMFSGLKSKIRY